ncbi:hypothetical protein RUMCAL_01947 [Ruminococcus callidus ATCC 27760]|uniref:Uncharacterized protein n=1 Tax=Ruminococcus callidus ATCC 27760 TaxID=411473 RepID=U2M619_9FIRM|nr:hypothetical protein RUMCAL_01947 [Ruminococcus callidus ATCC 27760]
MQSAGKSDYASYAQVLCSVSLSIKNLVNHNSGKSAVTGLSGRLFGCQERGVSHEEIRPV